MMIAPIIILGVPRSGTTLLRVLLGSHSQILAAPETPWIVGGYGPTSLRQLIEVLVDYRTGPARTLRGVDRAAVHRAAHAFLSELLLPYQQRSGKPHLVLKTPDDIAHLDFLLELFPQSSYLHICRDGRDVACSTLARKGPMIGSILNGYGEITLDSAMQRWCDWEGRIRQAIAGGRIARCWSLKYEDLVADPAHTLQDVCRFLQVEYEPAMLDYAGHEHELPAWEAGSQDVRRHERIDPGSLGRWQRELTAAQMARVDERFGSGLVELGYALCGATVALPAPASPAASAAEAAPPVSPTPASVPSRPATSPSAAAGVRRPAPRPAAPSPGSAPPPPAPTSPAALPVRLLRLVSNVTRGWARVLAHEWRQLLAR